MKFLNKLGNLLSISIFLLFLSITFFQNINSNPNKEKNNLDNNIVNCLENKNNSWESIDCLGKMF